MESQKGKFKKTGKQKTKESEKEKKNSKENTFLWKAQEFCVESKGEWEWKRKELCMIRLGLLIHFSIERLLLSQKMNRVSQFFY